MKHLIYEDWYFMDEDERDVLRNEALEQLISNHVMPKSGTWHYDEKIGEYIEPVYTSEQVDETAMNLNSDLWYAEMVNLDRVLPEPAFVYGTVEHWYGAVRGASLACKQNLNACLNIYGGGDCLRVYVDDNNELCGEELHHDGSNYWVMRMLNPKATDEEREEFYYLLENGQAREAMRYTISLGGMVSEVYGA